jgi:homoserine O-acetyltransferase
MTAIGAKRAFDIEIGIAKSANFSEGNVMTGYRTPRVWTAFLLASTKQDDPLARAKSVLCSIVLTFLIGILASSAAAAQTRQEGDFVLKDFSFRDGSKLAALSLHYITLGDPKSPAVLALHGTSGNGASLLSPDFGGALFGPGQPLDATKYFIILPDMIGAGKSSKPSDGMRMQFPHYNYDDMVSATYRLLTEGLKIRHVRLVMGNSMGGMLTWTFGEADPQFMDGLVPLASTPAPMSGRNWILRRMLVETIKADPDWNGGNYTRQPKSLKLASTFFGFATSGGNLGLLKRASTRQAADRLVEAQLAAPASGDANDVIYQFDSSRDYDPSPRLARIAAPVLAINSADDERNPHESGLLEEGIAQLKKGQAFLIPASDDTRGHGTTGAAKLWRDQLAKFLLGLPAR